MPESGPCFLSDASQDGHSCLRLCYLVLGCGENFPGNHQFPISLSSHLHITLSPPSNVLLRLSLQPSVALTPCAWHSAKDICYQPDDNLMNP